VTDARAEGGEDVFRVVERLVSEPLQHVTEALGSLREFDARVPVGRDQFLRGRRILVPFESVVDAVQSHHLSKTAGCS